MLTHDEAFKFVKDNMEVEFESTLSNAKLTELYKPIYNAEPRSSCNKVDIALQLRNCVYQMTNN